MQQTPAPPSPEPVPTSPRPDDQHICRRLLRRASARSHAYRGHHQEPCSISASPLVVLRPSSNCYLPCSFLPPPALGLLLHAPVRQRPLEPLRVRVAAEVFADLRCHLVALAD